MANSIPTAEEVIKQIKDRYSGRSMGGDIFVKLKPEKGVVDTIDNPFRLVGRFKTVAIHFIPMGGKRFARVVCEGAACWVCNMEKELAKYEDGKALSERISAGEKTAWNVVDLKDVKGEDGKFRWKILEHTWTVWKDISKLLENGEDLFDPKTGKSLIITKIVREATGGTITNYVARAGKVVALPKVITDTPLLDLDKFYKPSGDEQRQKVTDYYKKILAKIKGGGEVGEDDIPF